VTCRSQIGAPPVQAQQNTRSRRSAALWNNSHSQNADQEFFHRYGLIFLRSQNRSQAELMDCFTRCNRSFTLSLAGAALRPQFAWCFGFIFLVSTLEVLHDVLHDLA
jgi:hypothetical protein